MIGEKRTDITSSNVITAIRDSFVVFLLMLITTLIENPDIPTAQELYKAILSAALMAIISYMHASGIKHPQQE